MTIIGCNITCESFGKAEVSLVTTYTLMVGLDMHVRSDYTYM